MALSAFDEKDRPPDEEDLRDALGAAWTPWNALQDVLAARITPFATRWAYTSRSTGWGMRVLHGERVIVYMTPGRGLLRVSFVLGTRAVAAALESDLPAPVRAAIEGARTYAEGRGVRFEVRTVDDLPWIERLAVLKLTGALS